jgi:Tat protein secretion system quality control protein TatD with DNase activity
MGPDTGVRNDPRTISRGISAIAKVKGLTDEAVAEKILANFYNLFGSKFMAPTNSS